MIVFFKNEGLCPGAAHEVGEFGRIISDAAGKTCLINFQQFTEIGGYGVPDKRFRH